MQTDIQSSTNSTWTFSIPESIVIFLIGIGTIILFIEIYKKSQRKERLEKISICNVKPLDFDISSGLVLIVLGVLLQMFMVIYSKDANKKDVDKKEEKDKINCEKSELKDLVNFTVNNNAKQEQNSTYSASTPTKNNSSQIITTKKDNKTNECK